MHLSKRAGFVIVAIVGAFMLVTPTVALAETMVQQTTPSQNGHKLTVRMYFTRSGDQLTHIHYSAEFNSGHAQVTLQLYSKQVFLGGGTNFDVYDTYWRMFQESLFWTPCYAGHNSTHVQWGTGPVYILFEDQS